MRNALRAQFAVYLVGCIGFSTACTSQLSNTTQRADHAYNVNDNTDAEALRDQFYATDRGAQRQRLRGKLIRAYKTDLKRATKRGDLIGAESSLRSIASIWNAAEIRNGVAGKNLLKLAPTIDEALSLFSRAGKATPAILALELLRSARPANSRQYQKEQNALLTFTDELAVAEFGEGAERSKAIIILQRTLNVYPSPQIVDRLVDLQIERQSALEARFRRDGANFNIIRAHGPEVLRTSWHVIRAFARSADLASAPPKIDSLTGLGRNPEVENRLAKVLSRKNKPSHWVLLASSFRGTEDEPPDYGTGFAICETALEKHPRSQKVLTCAAEFAADKGSKQQAIRLYEKALSVSKLEGKHHKRLSALYDKELTRLSAAGRMEEAAALLKKVETFYRRQPAKTPRTRLAFSYTTMARGYLTLGNIASANDYLVRSLRMKSSVRALELLGLVASKQGLYLRAEKWFEQALRKTGKSPEGKIQSARIFRRLAEAKLQHRTGAGAKILLQRSLKEWRRISVDGTLSRVGRAELALERGKVLWLLERFEDAKDAFSQALEYAEYHGMYMEVVAYLSVQRDYVAALDTYHRALASPKIKERLKTYMSLWIIGLAKREKRTPDSQAFNYLKTVKGHLWHQSLAKYASGRMGGNQLRQKVKTPGQRAELAYYTAAVGPRDVGRARTVGLLKKVIASNVVLFFEFDMAKDWLNHIETNKRNERVGTALRVKAKDSR